MVNDPIAEAPACSLDSPMDAASTSPALADASPGSEGTAEQAVPPVVAVVVTCDPGWWLEECITSLAQQDYPQLSVLVVDADSAEDPTARIAAVMPNAYVRRTRRRRGFATAANEVLEIVEGASHFLFCHDDVVLSSRSVRMMVEESLRSNAGVVAPKLVGWFHPDRLLAVGMGADALGVPVALAERGDLDQEQHDAVRDVFYAPSACSLIRADLFATLGGFDGGYGPMGEDLDLAWRAHLAGARVITAPAATVAHLEATDAGQRALDGHLLANGPNELSRPDGWERGTDTRPLRADPWDEEEAPAAPVEVSRGTGHHASWRARREAERDLEHEQWSGDEEWETEAWELPRRVRRRDPHPPAAATSPVMANAGGPDVARLSDYRNAARLRAVASNYGWPRLIAHLPVAFVLALIQAAVLAARHDREAARRVLRPWAVLVRQSGSVRTRRKFARRARAVSDTEIVALQSRRSARFRDALRPVLAERQARPAEPDRRLAITVWLGTIAVLAFGTRQLLVGHLPTLGELAPWPALHTLAAQATSGWRLTGLGVAGPAPTAFGLMSVAGVVFLGHMTTLQHVLVLGMIPLGAIGITRLARPLASRRAQLVALVAYLAVPLPYDAVARGRWSGLVAYAAFPWILSWLAQATSLPPFGSGTPERSFGTRRRILMLGLLVGAASAVQPGMLLLVVAVGAALALGVAVTGGRAQSGRDSRGAGIRALGVAVMGAIGGLVLLFPWALSWLPPWGEWAMFTGAAPAAQPVIHVAQLLRFQTGPIGAGVIGYALLVASSLPLIIGQGWRSLWAARLWIVALVSFGLAWAGQHGALGAVWPSADVLLVPAATALALSAGLGMAAFEVDLSGFTFGWRQVVAGVAAAAGLLACIPVLAASTDGRWGQRRSGFDALLSWMPDQRAKGDFRVLWVGSPDVLPIAGWQDRPGLAYATSLDGPPTMTTRWPGTSVGATTLLAQAIELVRRGDTTAVGHLLAPMGVRYLVVVESPGPLDTSRRDVRVVPPDLHAGLQSQLDLRLVDQSAAATVYENNAWIPMRAALPERAVPVAELDDPRAARTIDLAPAPPILPVQSGPTTFKGDLAAGTQVEVAQAPSSHWQLTVDGRGVTRRSAFATGNLFSVGPGGPATLRYNTPIGWRVAYVIQAALWAAALVLVIRFRRRRQTRTVA